MRLNNKHRWKAGGLALAVALALWGGSGYQQLAGASGADARLNDSQDASGESIYSDRRESDRRDRDDQRKRRPDHFLGSRPDNLILGGFPIDHRRR